MHIKQLSFSQFRNFDHYELDAVPQFNLICGKNGSGKTSVLEAIHFLGLGRSFRTHQMQHIVQHEQNYFQVIGHVQDDFGVTTTIGIEKHLAQQDSQIKMGGKPVASTSELVRFMPLQLINHQAFLLLDAGPQHRREFLDWGVFYAEPAFLKVWQRYQRALKQRNALLRQHHAQEAEFEYWEYELTQQAILLTQYRTIYLDLFLPILNELLQQLLPLDKVTVQFHAGWDQDKDFQYLLKQSRHRDSQIGYTQSGPHRSDLKFKVGGRIVDEVMSRGQQKIFSVALRLAQGITLFRFNQKQCLYLIDDLPAELDLGNMTKVIGLLAQLQSQVFITAITQAALGELPAQYEMKMFHVEH